MSRRRKVKPKVYEISIESLSNEGRGISHYDDKIIFTRGALPGERVIASRSLSRAKYEEADVVDILESSPDRIEPKCDVYGICGGCSFQHLSSKNQINAKQSWLKSAFMGQAKIEPKKWLQPLQVESWGYRRKARLGVRYVEKKEKVLVGFRERKSSFITVMSRCEVLHPSLGDNLELLGECIGKLSIKKHVPQIEVAIAELDTILILRHLEPMTKGDESILKEYGDKLGITWYAQSGGLETIKPLNKAVSLTYVLPEHRIEMSFLPNDFTQVNFALNQKMINLAIELLDLNSEDEVIDLFCGLGNFTLPISRYVNKIVGIEGDRGLVERAKANADANEITNASFYKADLFEDVSGFEWFRGQKYNKALIDPARTGAIEIVELLPKLSIERLVYVSCNPATLARDTARLIELGFSLMSAGVMDMFPQTAHVESITLFIRKKNA
ncbi:MAG: 23S rRNA (uracil(1939)-C(5))-methyltransferase RlmD [Candidatus Thioglobus sp.]|nr:23S rRNA (uracil(1939)-C(5))-methyltransferase RlmD [Candidatus Thioglobus sp.]